MVWKKVQVSHLKVIGSISYTWILAKKITKLDPKRKANDYRLQQHYKFYRLIDIDTDRVSFKGVEDLGVKLQVAALEGGWNILSMMSLLD